MSTEADTGRMFVVPKLQAAGWDSDPHSIAEQRSFTGGRSRVRFKTVPASKTPTAMTMPNIQTQPTLEIDLAQRSGGLVIRPL